MRILITGGAGYIGSEMVRQLVAKHVDVTVIDTLEYGYLAAIPKEVTFVKANVNNKEVLDSLFSEKIYDGVIHFAGYLSVEESVRDPRKYFYNNVISPMALLASMEEHGVNALLFSSTAAVYGNPITVPIPEDHPKNPSSPYGLTKWCFEELLRMYDIKKTIRSISLRYFNASGAPTSGVYGEAHQPETHLIPLAMQTALGLRQELSIYGTDYETHDGTALRDYIHITDLGAAHLLAFDSLLNGHKSDVYNVGTGQGWTVREVIETVQKVSGVPFLTVEKPRRSGDPQTLVADASKLMNEFAWKPECSSLTDIINSAWKWHTTHPKGYESAL